MPVEEKPVQPRNSVGADHKPGCWNKSRYRNPQLVKNGYGVVKVGEGVYEGIQQFKVIPDPGSLGCQQDGDLPECASCEHLNPALSAKTKRESKLINQGNKNEQI